jgi:hypothetical protein
MNIQTNAMAELQRNQANGVLTVVSRKRSGILTKNFIFYILREQISRPKATVLRRLHVVIFLLTASI